MLYLYTSLLNITIFYHNILFKQNILTLILCFSYLVLSGEKMNFDDITLTPKTPYPKLTPCEDAFAVNLIKNLLSARTGILTAGLQFQFQAAVAEKVTKELAKIFEEAAILKATHLTLLTNAIVDFGGLPVYEDTQKVPFNANYINYAAKLKDMLNADIRLISATINNLDYAISATKNDDLKALLARIKQDDELTLAAFKQILTTVQFLSA